MMILIAGPYRSGTNDDPALIQKNVEEMESFALPIFRAGHIPLLGEWLALPLVILRDRKPIGDAASTKSFIPLLCACSRNATRCCGLEARRQVPMRWCASAANSG